MANRKKVRSKMNTTLLDKLTEGLNPQQKQAVEMPINSFTKVVAGAGTGKTKIISKRYIKLVNDLLGDKSVEKPLEHLLVITFTQKAAAEMKERILKELKANNINSFGQENRISTIHAFCSEMLRQHAIEANLSPNFKLAEDNELDEIYQTIISKIRYGEYDSIDFIDEILSELNLDKEILSHKGILKLKAAGDLEDVFDSVLPIIKQVKSLGLTPKEFLDKTLAAIPCYSSFVDEFLRKKYICSHFSDFYADEFIMAEDWCEFFRKSNFADENFKNLDDKKIFANFVEKFVDRHGTRKSPKTPVWTPKFDFQNTDFLTEISSVENRFTKLIAVIYAAYQRQLEELDLIDFDDLINKTLYVLKNNFIVRAYYKKYFKHIIVDEFQDTSGAQLDLLMCLLSDDEPNMTVVGDRKQSIYGFRYARMENLDILQKKIEQKFANKPNFDAEKKINVVKLETNYRSIPQVLESVNVVTTNTLGLNEPLSAFLTDVVPDSVKFSQPEKCANVDEYRTLEAKYIADEILRIMERDGLKYKDFAVLVKRHYQADTFEEELAKYGIPSVKKVNTSYFKKTIIQNIKCLLDFTQNVRSEFALVKLLEVKFSDRKIFDLKKSVDEILENTDDSKDLNFSEKILKTFETDVFDKINCESDVKNSVKLLYDVVLSLIKNKNKLSLSTIFYKLIDVYPPYQNLSGVAKSLADIDVMVFEKILADYVKNSNYSSIKNFLEYLETISEDKNFEMPSVFAGEIDAVKLMTIHASKGLEFPYTFVAGISNRNSHNNEPAVSIELNEDFGNFGLIIHKFNGKESLKSTIYKQIYKSHREYAEAKRLFYVAITRAKKYLNVLICNTPQEYLKTLIDAKNGSDTIKNLIRPVEGDKLSLENRPLCVSVPDKQPDLKIVAPKFKEENTEKLSVSFSKINAFNHCERNYLLKYIFGYPEIASNTVNVAIGSVLHSLIYHSVVNDKVLNEVEILNLLSDTNLENADYNRVLALYSAFKKSRFAKLSSENILAEYGFEFVYKNCIFKGDIDLVVKNADGTVDLVDFKTNDDLEKSLHDYNKQMFIYKSALEEQGLSVTNLIFANIKQNGVFEYNVSQKDLSEAKKSIDNDLKNIKEFSSQKISDLPKRNYCEYCGYGYICEK